MTSMLVLALCCTEIPVFPTVAAKVTFQEFCWSEQGDESRFRIPRAYSRDPYRFPDL